MRHNPIRVVWGSLHTDRRIEGAQARQLVVLGAVILLLFVVLAWSGSCFSRGKTSQVDLALRMLMLLVEVTVSRLSTLERKAEKAEQVT